MAEDRRTEAADALRHVAALAGLHIDRQRARHLAGAFEALRSDAERLRRLDLAEVEPTPSRAPPGSARHD